MPRKLSFLRQALLLGALALSLSGCSCKEWGYCPHIFPNAERFSAQ